MNTDFWLRIALACCVITGIWTAFRGDSIFGTLGNWGARLLPKWVSKPTFDCPFCMSSVHGTWIHFTFGGTLLMWPIFVLALCGCMKFIDVKLLSK